MDRQREWFTYELSELQKALNWQVANLGNTPLGLLRPLGLSSIELADQCPPNELLPFLSSESSVLPFLTAFSFPVAGDKSSMHTALGPDHC